MKTRVIWLTVLPIIALAVVLGCGFGARGSDASEPSATDQNEVKVVGARPKYTDYICVLQGTFEEGWGDSFSEKINKKMAEGYTPIGGPTVSDGVYLIQAMAKCAR